MVLPCLGLVAALVPPPDALPTLKTSDQLTRAMASVGYGLTAEPELYAPNRLTHDGVTVNVEVAVINVELPLETYPVYATLILWLELPALGRRPSGFQHPRHSFHLGAVAPSFLVHLGGTATEYGQVDIRAGTSLDGVRRALDRFWSEGRRYARSNGVPFAPAPEYDPKRTPLADSLVLDLADEESFRRALLSWGATFPSMIESSSQSWFIQASLADRMVWLRQATRGTRPLAQRVDLVRLTKLPTTQDPYAGRKSARDPVPTYALQPDGPHLVEATQSIDLTKGVTLGELRKRIEAFAAAG